MILSSELYREHGVRKGILVLIKFIIVKYFTAFFRLFKRHNRSPFYRAKYHAKGIRNYPLLLTDEDAQLNSELNSELNPELNPELKCISCGLCEKICPTQCISIKSDEKSKVPRTLMTGPSPLSFDIKLQQCTRCGYCVDVCPVEAIELSGIYDFYSNPTKMIWDKKELTAKDI